MYRAYEMRDKNYSNLKLQVLLGKLHTKPVSNYKREPVVHSSSDVLKAREVLDRLLARPSRDEISFIKVIPLEVNER